MKRLGHLCRQAASIPRRWMTRLRLRRQLRRQPRRIVIGASQVFEPGWTPTDRDTFDLLHPQRWRRWIAPASVDAFLAEHVWEHLTLEEGRLAARTCYTYLKPGGYIRVAVPDGCSPDPAFLDYIRPGGNAAADHRVIYTHRLLRSVFESAGFHVTLLEYFDEAGQFHATDWNADDGKIWRSLRFDPRNAPGRMGCPSIILDAVKPTDSARS